MRDQDVAKAAGRMVDAKYHLGPGDGYDCLSMLWEFYGSFGINMGLPAGFTKKDYASRWMNGEGREEFLKFMMGFGSEVHENFIIAGDLLIFAHEGQPFPGIYLGTGHMLCAFERGVLCVPLKFFKKALVGARRCQP